MSINKNGFLQDYACSLIFLIVNMTEQIKENRKLFVWNLPWEMRGKELAEAFKEFWDVEFATVVLDKETKKSKGFWFVTFVNIEEAKKALTETNEKEIAGRKIYVSYAKETPERA